MLGLLFLLFIQVDYAFLALHYCYFVFEGIHWYYLLVLTLTTFYPGFAPVRN
jgi:hypothetical protein